MEAAAAAGEPGAAAGASALAAPEAAPQPRLALYSGHDTTIMPLLVTLGGDLSHWPPYVSNLVRPWRGGRRRACMEQGGARAQSPGGLIYLGRLCLCAARHSGRGCASHSPCKRGRGSAALEWTPDHSTESLRGS
jgi:hypothetical protein